MKDRPRSWFIRYVRIEREVPHTEPEKNPFRIREVADDFAYRRRKLPQQGRDGNDLIERRKLRRLREVDDLDPTTAVEVLAADALEISERRYGRWRLAGEVESQFPYAVFRRDRFLPWQLSSRWMFHRSSPSSVHDVRFRRQHQPSG